MEKPVPAAPGSGPAAETSGVSAQLDRCLDVLKAAKTDTEKFAALMLVTKIVKAEESDAAMRKKIFDAVGFTFLSRLLTSSTVPDGCDGNMYKSLAMTLLACFSTDPQLAKSPQMLEKIPQFIECVSMKSGTEEAQSAMREDAYQVLVGIATTETGRKELMKGNTVAVLCDICLKEEPGHEMALKVLFHLLNWNGRQMWQTNEQALNHWIGAMATEFQQNQDARKFQLCEKLSAIITTSNWMPEEVPDWGAQIHKGLYDALRSKLGEVQRDPTLRLVATMLRCFGVDWALGQTGDKRKFFLLLVHLACVETRMTLENTTPQYIHSKTSVLTSCYTLLEVSIQYLTCGPSLELDRQQVIQLHSAMTGAFGAIMFYMNSVKDQEQQLTSPLMRATVHVLTVWLAEETTALRQEVYRLLPFLLKVGQKSYKEVAQATVCTSPSSSSSSCSLSEMSSSSSSVPSTSTSIPSAAAAPSSSSSTSSSSGFSSAPSTSASSSSSSAASASSSASVPSASIPDPPSLSPPPPKDLLRLLLPALCHLTAEEEPRKILRDCKGLELLLEYFAYHWRLVNELKRKESEEALVSLSSIFLNISLQDQDVVRTHPVFTELLGLISNVQPQAAVRKDLVVLTFYETVLGLAILRILADCQDTSLSLVKKFVQSALEFMKKILVCGSEGMCEISHEFQQYWDEVTELWFLAMQILAASIPLIPWLTRLFIDSGWLETSVEVLKSSHVDHLDEEMKGPYNTLFTAIIKSDGTSYKKFVDLGGETLARKHGMDELEAALTMYAL
ncbi:neurochondrin-like [Diadema antillarum]|uniref:neurochondrin-like n=1 Tax=Diadema antillarum TaxID=105358 RepID=UPI003A8C1CB2